MILSSYSLIYSVSNSSAKLPCYLVLNLKCFQMLPFYPQIDGYLSIVPAIACLFGLLIRLLFVLRNVLHRNVFFFLPDLNLPKKYLHGLKYAFFAVSIVVGMTTMANAQANCPCTLFHPTDAPDIPVINDGQSLEVGMKFKSTMNGYITGFRFFKGAGTTGTHIGHLWSSNGIKLAEASFLNETGFGWQQVLLNTPVAVIADTTYIVSYFSTSGQYPGSNNYFTNAVVNSPLRALANGEEGGNGVYIYSPTPAFPVSTYQSSNYWADVIFSDNNNPDLIPPVIENINAVPNINGSYTISWTTNELADSKVDHYYDADVSTVVVNNDNPGYVINHSITLSGLSPQTIYYFRIVSADQSNNSSTAPNPPATLNFTTPAPTCVQDRLTTDFNAGNISSGLFVSASQDGEIILKPGNLSTEFSSLPSATNWDNFTWATGGTSIVTAGKLLVNGSRYNTTPGATVFGPGSAIEFAAVFGMAGAQHIGFGSGTDATGTGGIYNGQDAWAMFSTGTGYPQLAARTFDGITTSDIVIPGDYIGTAHIYRIEWTVAGNFNYYIDGKLVYAENTLFISAPMRPAISDFTNDTIPLTVDWIHLSPYSTTPAIFTSRIFDATVLKDWGIATWTAEIPAGTSLALSQRQGNSPVPDASWTDFKSIAHTGEIVGGTSRYIQYRAVFSTSMTAFTPVLKDFGITCSASIKGPMPALSSFTVTKLGMNAQLQWATPWEQNNKGFEIQRSANDSLHWQTVAFVNGTGTNQTAANYEYLDKNLATGKFYYRIKQTDLAGNYKLSDNIAVVFGNILLLELRQNYPNPFNVSTTIRFFIPDAGRTQLLLYDQMGRLIRTLTDEIKNPGTYQVTMNKSGLSAGMYYYKLKTKDEEAIRKMIIQ